MKIFDIETDNLLDKMTLMWCAWTKDTLTGEFQGYLRPEHMHLDPSAKHLDELWVDLMNDSDGIAAHNGLDFDIDALEKLYGDAPGFAAFRQKCHDEIGTWFIDTLILARLLYPDVGPMDWAMYNKGTLRNFPDTPAARKKLFGNHNLAAWGYRLGVLKASASEDDEPPDFSVFTPHMYDPYGKQDIVVTAALLERLVFKSEALHNTMCIELEHRFALYLYHQMRAGVTFDREKAEMLLMYWKRELSRRLVEMRAQVPDILVEEDFVPKRNNAKLGRVAGVPIVKRKLIPFNPRSADHIIFFLMEKYQWEPMEFTSKKSDKWPKGKPQVTHEVLAALPYPEAPLLARIKLLMDRIALVETSPSSWIKNINPETGRIHGRIIHNGTPTSRCRHSKPNLGNIPSPKATWGKVLRSLFIPNRTPGWLMLGCDADGLEMRLLSHYLFPFDGGAFYEATMNGSKEDGTDSHSLNRDAARAELQAAGLNDIARLLVGSVGRECLKQVFYAMIYGAFPRKICMILIKHLGVDIPKHKMYAVGQLLVNALKETIVGYSELIEHLEDIYNEAEETGKWPHLFMPDGRPAPIRSKHSILNTANQTLGAVVEKVALVRFWMKMEMHGLKIRVDWNPLLFVHDEFQIEVAPGNVTYIDAAGRTVEEPKIELARRLASEAVTEAGEILGLNVPLVGSAAIGRNWSETH